MSVALFNYVLPTTFCKYHGPDMIMVEELGRTWIKQKDLFHSAVLEGLKEIHEKPVRATDV